MPSLVWCRWLGSNLDSLVFGDALKFVHITCTVYVRGYHVPVLVVVIPSRATRARGRIAGARATLGLVVAWLRHGRLWPLLPCCSCHTAATAIRLPRDDAAAPASHCGAAATSAVASPSHSHSLRLCTVVCPGPMPATTAAHGCACCRLAIYGAAVAHARTFPQTAWGCSTCTSTALMAPSASRQEENGQSSYLQPLLCHPDQMTPIAQFGMVKSPRLASSRLALHHEVTEPPVPTLP
jgi:hypothetical protein